MSDEKLSEQLIQPPRGTRDFSGPDARLRARIISILQRVFTLYGFSPLETPAFENYAVLSAKFAGGEEILKETYRFTDQGKRELGLRYDVTVPLCRFVAGNPNLPKPFKRYAIGQVWRDGPLKLGRYREFTQCDADTVGAAGLAADAEILALACEVFKQLDLPVRIKLNSRPLLSAMLEEAAVTPDLQPVALLIFDKLEKIGSEGVSREWREKALPEAGLKKLLELNELKRLGDAGMLTELDGRLSSQAGKDAVKEIRFVLALCESLGCRKNVTFDPSLARGLNYYTGMIFEGVLEIGGEIKLTSSLCGGGRYDDLIGRFSAEAGGRSERIPAVGISFGLDVICDALTLSGKTIDGASSAGVYVFSIGGVDVAPVAQEFRSVGIPVQMDLMGRSPSKNLESAVKSGCKFAVIVGPQEQSAGKVKLRNLVAGTEELFVLSDAIAKVREM